MKKGYAGTAMLIKKSLPVVAVTNGFGCMDDQGRCITAEFEQFYVVGTYTPNSGQNLKFADRRKEWDTAFREYITRLKGEKPVLWTGDLNVAVLNCDVYDGETNKGRKKSAGFTDYERTFFRDFLIQEDLVDVYREFYPDVKGVDCHTFWSVRTGAKKKKPP